MRTASPRFERRRVETAEQYEEVMRFWVRTYHLEDSWLRSAYEVVGDVTIWTYHHLGRIVGTVGMRLPTEGPLLHGL